MKEISIYGANRFESFSKTREGSRAIVLQKGKILLSHERNTDIWMIPGGGREAGETPEACCVREAEEETGLIVRTARQLMTLYEYYEECRYISYYYLCEAIGQGTMRLTAAEQRRGLTPTWLPLQDAAELFSRHQEYAATDEEKRGIYLREYTVLAELVRERKKEENAFSF